jgi:NAD(P)-dependent dehydrogenase (short-subunit alcohol dehydrogenase family)
MKVNLTGQVALVTGAGRNIGQAIADALAANGAQVVYSDVDAEAAQRAADAVGQHAMRLDVADAADVARVVGDVARQFGRLDILVNNAGVNTAAKDRATVEQFSLDEWQRVLNVDLTGLFLMSRAVAEVMLQQGSGRIINIASVAGLVPLRLQSAFIAAKAGVVNLTKSMALELGPRGVLVNGVAPGSIITEGTRELWYSDPERTARMLSHVPLGRPGTSEEVAHCVLFLAAPESSYINGHVLVVDGGWTAGFTRDF